MTECTCRKGAVAIDCERHSAYAFVLNPPRTRSLWKRLIRWVRT